MPWMAAMQRTQGDLSRVLAWVGVMIVVVGLFGVAVMFLRRRFVGPDHPDATDAGLMDQIRAMRKNGQISEDEYQAMRRSMASRLRRQLDEHESPSSKTKTSGPPAPAQPFTDDEHAA